MPEENKPVGMPEQSTPEQPEEVKSEEIIPEDHKKKDREKTFKIILWIVLVAMILGLMAYLIWFLVQSKNTFGFANYLFPGQANISANNNSNENVNDNDNTNTNLNSNVNANTNNNQNTNINPDITASWIHFNTDGLLFLYPPVLDQSKKVQQLKDPIGNTYTFYNYGIFGFGIHNNPSNVSVKTFIHDEYDPQNQLQLVDVNIGHDGSVPAVQVTETDAYQQKYGVLGIRYFFAGKNKIFSWAPGQAYPTPEAEQYFVNNNLSKDAVLNTVEVQ